MRRLRLAALAAGLALAAPATAGADSISFLRQGDIWVAAPDGSHQQQVTHDGGYDYQSRADDGSYIALHGRLLRRLTPTGTMVAEFSTPVSGAQTAPNTSYFKGPFKPEISPDGTKVAYEYWHDTYLTDPGCDPSDIWNCTQHRTEVGIGYSYADRQTDWDEPGLGRQSGWVDPSWIDNSTLLQSDKSVLPNVDAIIDHPGDGEQTITEWFADDGAWHIRDGEVSRRGDAAVFVTSTPRSQASDPHFGQQDDQVTVYALHGAPPALPDECFSIANADKLYQSPSFAPDGHAVAFAQWSRADLNAGSIAVAQVPNQAGGCTLPPQGPVTVIDDAAEPDWGPAPVPDLSAGGSPQPSPGDGARGTTPTSAPAQNPAKSGRCRVPKVVGLTPRRAKAKLVKAGCRAHTRRSGHHVRRQSIKAGHTVAVSTPVTLTLGR